MTMDECMEQFTDNSDQADLLYRVILAEIVSIRG